MNEKVKNEVNGENIEILDSDSTTESKSSKIKIVIPILATLIVLLLMCGGVFLFINKVFNANYFLEESSKSVSSFAKKVLNGMDMNNEYLSDLDKYDVVSNTNIKLSSSTSALENLNGISLNLDVNARVKEKYVSMDATLKQDSENIKASAVINNDKVYVESKEFFDKIVSIDSSVKVEDIISEYSNTIGNYDILEIVNKYISYYFESLKEAKISTEYDGFNAVYTYEINDDNIDKVNDKFMSLIKEDEVFKDIVTEEMISNNISVVIKVKMLTNEVSEFVVKYENEEYKGVKIDENKYEVTDGENKVTLEISSNILSLSTKINNEEVKVKFEVGENSSSFSYKTSDTDILFNLEKLEGNTNKLSFNLVVPSTQKNVSEYKINGEVSAKNEDKKTSASGKVTFNYSENEVTLNLSSDTEYGENLFSRKDVSGSINITDVTDEEKSTAMFNVMTKLMKFKFFGLIYGMNEMNDETVDNSFYDSEVSM